MQKGFNLYIQVFFHGYRIIQGFYFLSQLDFPENMFALYKISNLVT